MWNNMNLSPGESVYLDIYNIEQPKRTDIITGPAKKISCTIDLDDIYSNGVNGYQEVLDSSNSL